MRFAGDVLLVLHTGHSENLRTAEQIGHQLAKAGIGLRVLADEATHIDAALCDQQMPVGPQAAAGAELIVVLGGDGTYCEPLSWPGRAEFRCLA